MNPSEILEALQAPFRAQEIKWKPLAIKGNRALALPYIDARVVQDRLDQVLGIENWQDEYECLEDGSVLCRLRLRLFGEWITKMDVGSPSEQPDSGDRLKAALSDALKRAAVKFGLGRYLYRLPAIWWDYDPVKKAFLGSPQIPTSPGTAPATAPPRPAEPPVSGKTPAPRTMPKTGEELFERLVRFENGLVQEGAINPGELMDYVRDGVSAAYGSDIKRWPATAIRAAQEEVEVFLLKLKKRQGARA